MGLSLRKNRRRNKTANGAERKSQVFDDASANQMFLNDALHRLRSHMAVPDALGVDERDRSALADAEAIGARTVDLIEQPEFIEPPLEIVPSFDALFARAALRLGLIGAQKNMTANRTQLQIGGAFGQAVRGHLG